MGAVIWLLFLGGIAGLTYLGYRWTKPRPTASDLHRADDAQTQDRADAKTVRERVHMYVTMYSQRR